MNFPGPHSPRNKDSNPFRYEFCHSRPKLSDGSKLYPYCGRTCADKAEMKDWTPTIRSQPSQMSLLGGTNCDFCFARPKYFDGTKMHPFGGKTCAKNAKGLTNGHARRHLGENLCAMYLQAPGAMMSDFYGQEGTYNVENRTPVIFEIPASPVTSGLCRLKLTDPDCGSKIYDGWKHPYKTKPRVRGILKIVSPPGFYTDYFQHRDHVLGDIAGDSPNEQLLFHGTDRACSVGEDSASAGLCRRPDCYLCCIIRSSFDIEKCGTSNKFCKYICLIIGIGKRAQHFAGSVEEYIQHRFLRKRMAIFKTSVGIRVLVLFS
ncbi:hypothetical protein P691DRAFT_778238 [Macrolepiota fuliginosa MF-IS2]|uniref:Uncharacterized protein n=1 Tax=Macrolepiota fuliginosa MF-IS2 TaxID=1400762 RepID=A0A9P6BXW1_9AGAR|nr:hypothetical protein P691DRAFT_778238 [Macrolepiota fuliginosa MF-IS2]